MATDSLKVNEPLVQEAEHQFMKSILCDKENCYSFFSYGSFLFQLKRFDKAEQCFLECLKLNLTFYPALKQVKEFLNFLHFLLNFFSLKDG